VGKTAFTMGHLARNMAANGVGVLRFNAEMDLKEIISRDVAAESGVDSLELMNPQQDVFTQGSWDTVYEAEHRMVNYPLWTYTPGAVPLTIPRMEAIGRHHILKYGVKVIIIDQLDKIAVNVRGTEYERMTACMKGVTALVKRLRIPILLLCQIGRKGDDKEELTMGDIKATGQIEQDAHAVILMNNVEPQTNTEVETWNDYHVMKIKIAASGGGPEGSFRMGFYPKLSKFKYPA
jgi:replicative DNA helicase